MLDHRPVPALRRVAGLAGRKDLVTAKRGLRVLDPTGAKECAAAVRALADESRPAQARRLGGSAYWRLPVGDWRVLYQPDDDTVTVIVLKAGRVT